MVTSPDQKAGQNSNIKVGNKSFERVENFKHLGSTLTNKISFMKKLVVDRSRGMLTIIRCRVFCPPVYYPKT
jgi:hypothetical protein